MEQEIKWDAGLCIKEKNFYVTVNGSTIGPPILDEDTARRVFDWFKWCGKDIAHVVSKELEK